MSGLELGVRTLMQFIRGVGTEVGQGMSLAPGPQIFDRVELGRVGGQALNDDVARWSNPPNRAPRGCGAVWPRPK